MCTYVLTCNFLMVNLIFMCTLLNSVKFLHILGHAEDSVEMLEDM